MDSQSSHRADVGPTVHAGPVSPRFLVPLAAGQVASALALNEAPPPVEPPQVSDVFPGLRERPNTSLQVDPPAPNSGVFDLPITSPPLRSIRSTKGSDFSGTWSANSGEPQIVRAACDRVEPELASTDEVH